MLDNKTFEELRTELLQGENDEFTTLSMAIKEEKYKNISDSQIQKLLDWYGEDENTVTDVRNY